MTMSLAVAVTRAMNEVRREWRISYLRHSKDRAGGVTARCGDTGAHQHNWTAETGPSVWAQDESLVSLVPASAAMRRRGHGVDPDTSNPTLGRKVSREEECTGPA